MVLSILARGRRTATVPHRKMGEILEVKKWGGRSSRTWTVKNFRRYHVFRPGLDFNRREWMVFLNLNSWDREYIVHFILRQSIYSCFFYLCGWQKLGFKTLVIVLVLWYSFYQSQISIWSSRGGHPIVWCETASSVLENIGCLNARSKVSSYNMNFTLAKR